MARGAAPRPSAPARPAVLGSEACREGSLSPRSRGRLPEPRLVRGVPATRVRGLPGLSARARAPARRVPGVVERRLPELLEPARLRLAAYVGSPPSDLAFATNASSALNTAIRSLELGRGDEVLLGDSEYGGLEILWQWFAARTGATLRRAPFSELEPGPKTRVVFCSHIEWTTGQHQRRRGRCAPRRGLPAHSRSSTARTRPGQIDVDLAAIGADVYAGNCHKWLCAPKGSGVPLRAARAAAPRSTRRSSRGTARRCAVQRAPPLAGNARPGGAARRPGRDRLPGASTTGRRSASAATRCSRASGMARARAAGRRVRPDARIPAAGRGRRRAQAAAVRATPDRGAGRRDERTAG